MKVAFTQDSSVTETTTTSSAVALTQNFAKGIGRRRPTAPQEEQVLAPPARVTPHLGQLAWPGIFDRGRAGIENAECDRYCWSCLRLSKFVVDGVQVAVEQ